MLYVYNLLLNKDSFGAHTFTRIFENTLSSVNRTPLIAAHLDYTTKLDEEGSNLIDNTEIADIKYYLSVYSPRTKFESGMPKGWQAKPDNAYFTFDIPSFYNDVKATMETRIDRNVEKVHYTPGEIVDVLVQQIKHLYGDENVKTVTNADIENPANNYPAFAHNADSFIWDGIVYINTDRTNNNKGVGVVAHEMSHLVFAALKKNDPDAYYDMLASAQASPDFNSKYEKYKDLYPDAIGTDLVEEIVCKTIEDFLAGKMDADDKFGQRLALNPNIVLDELNKICGNKVVEPKPVTYVNKGVESNPVNTGIIYNAQQVNAINGSIAWFNTRINKRAHRFFTIDGEAGTGKYNRFAVLSSN